MPNFLLMIVLTLAVANAGEQPNRCAQCHYVNLLDVPSSVRLSDWGQSAHAKHGIGCERCHDGDPATFLPAEAHRGVLSSRHETSPVNRSNLPTTCGECHQGPARAFTRSRHLVLLQQGDGAAPTCSTCHGAMTARRPSPATLEGTCASCHEPDSIGAVYPAVARSALEEVEQIRKLLLDATTKAARIANPIERQRLGAEAQLIGLSLTSAADALHAFDLRAFSVMVRTVRERTERLQHDVKEVGG